ncbi:hypothetical protein ACIRPQ_29320 [Streptomyces sp. NPDC101213]|uniref:hypothetical protein n=1 Tax=Streptomyces sp. NPDC101213 TaxID=3366130 RepID=UPI00380D7A9C
MSEETRPVRRPLHLLWDAPIVQAMAAANPNWGTLPCPLDGQANRSHAWIRHEVAYDDRGEMDRIKAVACSIRPEPKPVWGAWTMTIGRKPAVGFELGRTPGARPGTVAVHITDLRTGEKVFHCLFADDDVAGVHFHVGNAVAATYGDEQVWDADRIREVARRSPSLLEDACRVCGLPFGRHERLVVRAAWWPAEEPPRLRDVLVIACGPDVVAPGGAASC